MKMRVLLETGGSVEIEGNYIEIANDGSLIVGTKEQHRMGVAGPNGMQGVQVTQKLGHVFRRDLWREVEPVEGSSDEAVDLVPELAGAVN